MANLINRKAIKEITLRYAKSRTGCSFERVSKKFLDDLEIHVRNKIFHAVAHHRSVGKTITDLF